MHQCRNAPMQECKNSGMQECTNAGMQECTLLPYYLVTFYYLYFMELFIKILYVLPVYQSVMLAILLYASGRQERGYSKRIMGAFLVFTAIYFSFNLLFILKGYEALLNLYFLILPIILVFIPLFYLYLESITDPDFHFRKQQLFHFLPAILFLLLKTPYFFATDQERLAYITHGFRQPEMSPVIYYLFILYLLGIYVVCNLQLAYYVYRSLKLFHRHQVYIANRFSYTEHTSLRWIKTLIFCFVVFIIIIELLYIFGIRKHPAARIFYNIFMLGISLFAGYHALMQKDIKKGKPITDNDENEIMVEVPVPVPGKVKYSGSSLTAEQKEILTEKLEKLMREGKVYTNNELIIEDVALLMETNSKYLSQILNEAYKKNFYTFINCYRVEEAKRLMEEDKVLKYSIHGISQMAGFASKSSFNEAFKNIEGTTPSEYRKKLVS